MEVGRINEGDLTNTIVVSCVAGKGGGAECEPRRCSGFSWRDAKEMAGGRETQDLRR